MKDRSKVTLTLTETEARWLLLALSEPLQRMEVETRIAHELKHALALCECAEISLDKRRGATS